MVALQIVRVLWVYEFLDEIITSNERKLTLSRKKNVK